MSGIVLERPYRLALTGVAAVAVFAYIATLQAFGKLANLHTVADWAPVAWSAITFTISAVYLVKIAFEKWMWRWKILRERLVRFPDLSGVWLARWDSIAFQSEHRSLVTIEHDFDHIVCTSTRRNAEGETISESVSISCQLQYNEQTKRIELSVVYRNNPGLSADQARHGRPHNGCAHLQLVDGELDVADWSLSGDYWTNKPWPGADGRGGTRGRLTMHWQAKRKDYESKRALRNRLLGQTMAETSLADRGEPDAGPSAPGAASVPSVAGQEAGGAPRSDRAGRG
jgi:hypothetical protein